MTAEIWTRLSFYEQLSNIDGEINRLIDSHEKFLAGKTDKDYSLQYLPKITDLIRLTFADKKNLTYKLAEKELYDEIVEILHYLNGEVSSNYIKSYWNQFTKKIS